MQLRNRPWQDLPLTSRGYVARPMSPIVQTVLSVCVAVGLALGWIYLVGQQETTGSRLDNETGTVAAKAPDRALKPSEAMPGSAIVERDTSEGMLSPDGTAEPALGIAARPESAQAVVEDNERRAFEDDTRNVRRDIARTTETAKQADAPQGNLAISGRVLTRAGEPVSGIELTASATHVFDPDQGKLVVTRGYQRQTISGYDGAYEFQQLADGEYHIRTNPTEQYAQARISVRAGVDFADLVLTAHRDLRVYGVVSTATGEPLARVQVQALIRAGKAVTTDQDGRYVFAVKALENSRRLFVRASKDGYKDKKIPLKVAELDAEDEVELNIVMEPDSTALAVVSGTVRSSEDGPVAGQRVQLSSGKARQSYRADTDKEGKFVMPEVEISDDYMVSINAANAYEDYFQRNLRVTEDGLTLSIELKAKDVGTLSGQMVDVYGNPISNFSLVLQTKKTSYDHFRVVGDAVGAFTVENAPAGELRLKTKSNPYHRIDGIRLAKGGERHVQVVLDAGYGEIRGRVVDDRDYPLAVPSITLTWSHVQHGVRSTSRRTTAADAQGDFRFTQLGPGAHTITVNAPGYKPARLHHDVAEQGSDVVVRLERRKNK